MADRETRLSLQRHAKRVNKCRRSGF